jgi:hypothetical protein
MERKRKEKNEATNAKINQTQSKSFVISKRKKKKICFCSCDNTTKRCTINCKTREERLNAHQSRELYQHHHAHTPLRASRGRPNSTLQEKLSHGQRQCCCLDLSSFAPSQFGCGAILVYWVGEIVFSESVEIGKVN